MSSLHFISASTTGHTDYVIDVLADYLAQQAPDVAISRQKAEQAEPEDLLRGDVVILGSGTWNTGGSEGQLNPHMHHFLMETAADLDLQGKAISAISLGDDRYYYRTRCTEHVLRYIREHHGKLFLPPLVLVNEPYGQEEKIGRWGVKLSEQLKKVPSISS